MSPPALGFIGVGDLALYTIRGLRRGGYTQTILLSPRNRDKARWLSQHLDCEVQPDNQTLVDRCDQIIIATRPPQCLETLASLDFRPGQTLISVVAGIASARLRAAMRENVEIVRAMPVSSAEVGASSTLVFPDSAPVRDLFAHCGDAIGVDEEQIFEQGSVHACVYSWFFALFEELIRSTSGPGLPRELAARLVLGMARGAAELSLAQPGSSPGEIARGIATEGTYSKLGLDLLRREKAFDSWQKACDLLRQKLDSGGS